MRRFILLSAATASLALLAACGGGNDEDDKLTEIRMDDLDSLEGTISDDILNTDQSTDEGPMDAPPVTEGKSNSKEDNDGEEKTDDAADETAAPETEDKAEAE